MIHHTDVLEAVDRLLCVMGFGERRTTCRALHFLCGGAPESCTTEKTAAAV